MTVPALDPDFGVGDPLVDEPTAINHLRLATPLAPERAADLTIKIQAASDRIRQYLKLNADPAWTAATAPPVVQMCVLLLLGAIWQNLGDDETQQKIAEAWNVIGLLLAQSRPPAYA